MKFNHRNAFFALYFFIAALAAGGVVLGGLMTIILMSPTHPILAVVLGICELLGAVYVLGGIE